MSSWKEKVIVLLFVTLLLSDLLFATQHSQLSGEGDLDVYPYEDDLTQFLHNTSLRQWSNTTRGTDPLGKIKNLTEVVTSEPVVSDLTATSFRVSWVADIPVKGGIEYCASGGSCTNMSISPGSIAYDSLPYLASGAVLVGISGLTPGTTYYYRLTVTTQSGDTGYYPSSPPYPSITTKTSTDPGYPSNPTFNLAPYYDKNNNNQYDGEPTDAKQHYFIAYLTHPGCEPLATRGNTWVAQISTSNLRNNTASGGPHQITSGDKVEIRLFGMYNDQRPALWNTGVKVYTWSGGSPINLVYKTEKYEWTAGKSAFPSSPVISDLTATGFRVSWVSEMPIKGSIEYCASGGSCTSTSISPATIVNDTQPYLDSGGVMIGVSGLSPGSTYFYRLRAITYQGTTSYYPSSPPYPSITTKTSTDPGYPSNPTFNIAPYYDRNNNNVWDNEPTDLKQNYFLIYLFHTGCEPLVSRGNPWVTSISTSNLRNNTAAGGPHQLVSGDQVSLLIKGMFSGGLDYALWINSTPPYTWTGGSPVNLVYRTERLSPVEESVVFTVEYHWVMDPVMGTQYPNGTKKVQGIFSKLWLEGDSLGVPDVSDVTTARFRVSWVNDYPATGSVEYSQDPGLAGAVTVTDTSPNLANGTSMVTITSLSQGTTYYYRIKTTDSTGGDVRYYPQTPPYPSVTTKASTAIGYPGNPVLYFAPYHDTNNNNNYDSGEPRLRYFLVKFIHPGAGAMVARGSAGSGWVATIDTKNLRDDTPEGAPHRFTSGDSFTLVVKGLYDDGSGKTFWKNDTYSTTWDGSTTSYYIRCKKSSISTLPGALDLRIRFNASVPGYLGTSWVRFNSTGWHGAGLITFYDASMYSTARGMVSGSGEVATTVDGGLSFRVSNDSSLSGFEWYGIAYTGATDAWVAGSASGTYRICRTSDSGVSWNIQKEGNGTLRSISFSGTSNGVSAGDGIILYTTNGGASWSQSSDVDIGTTRYNRVVVSGVRAIAVGSGGKILVNSDITASNGGDWVVKSSGTTNDLYGVAILGGNAIAVGDSVILYSTDYGNTWSRSAGRRVDGYSYRGVSFGGGSSLAWAVGLRGRTLVSTDGGRNWGLSYADTIADLTSVSSQGSSSGLIVGSQGTISRFNGTSWTIHSVPANDRVTITIRAMSTQSRGVALRFDSQVYDSRYSIKALSLARVQRVWTCYKSGWATGAWAASFDNEDANNDTIIIKVNVTMIRPLFNYTEIDRAYMKIINQGTMQVVWQGYMSKVSCSSRTCIFQRTMDIASWSDGYYKVVVDGYEVDTSSDRLLGEINAKVTYFIIT